MSIMLTYKLPVYLVGIITLAILDLSLADILVYKNHGNSSVEKMRALAANFGPLISDEGFMGYVVYASPPNACVYPVQPPKANGKGPYIALVRRYNCTFATKVLNAQHSGYDAVIVRNVGSDTITIMNGDNDIDEIRIPAVFVGESDGIMIKDNFLYDRGYFVVLTNNNFPYNIENYLLPMAITIGICFILMLIFMLVKCVRDYKKSRRHRLSSRSLKKLPIHKFKKGDPYDCCAICLDDYAENDKLRVLPCSHAYHSKCIDPWLTKNRRVCPVCKRKVIIGNEQPSDIDTDSEDDTAPLINTNGITQGGTFAHQAENPFLVAERDVERRRSNRRTLSRYHNLEESSSEEDQDTNNPVTRQYGNDDEESQDECNRAEQQLMRSPQVDIDDLSQRQSQSDARDCIV